MRSRGIGRRRTKDLSWREFLRRRGAVRELVTRYVPELRRLARELDFSKAKIPRGVFVDAAFRELSVDAVWRVPFLRQGAPPVHIIIEHQSSPHPMMALRMFRYVAGHYPNAIASKRGRLRLERKIDLPLVLPIVLYCGSRPWNAAMTLHELSSGNRRLTAPTSEQRYFLVDIHGLDWPQLSRGHNALSGLLMAEKGRITDERPTVCLKAAFSQIEQETDRDVLEAACDFIYTMRWQWKNPRDRRAIERWLDARKRGERIMERTWYEYISEVGREDCLRECVSSLRRTFAECGVSFKRYEKDIKKISNAGRIVDLAVRFARAKDPRAYLRRRFGH